MNTAKIEYNDFFYVALQLHSTCRNFGMTFCIFILVRFNWIWFTLINNEDEKIVYYNILP